MYSNYMTKACYYLFATHSKHHNRHQFCILLLPASLWRVVGTFEFAHIFMLSEFAYSSVFRSTNMCWKLLVQSQISVLDFVLSAKCQLEKSLSLPKSETIPASLFINLCRRAIVIRLLLFDVMYCVIAFQNAKTVA